MLKNIKTYIRQEPWDELVMRKERELTPWLLTFLAFVVTYMFLEAIVKIFNF